MKPADDRLLNRNFTLILSGRSAAILCNSLYAVVLVLYLKRMTGSASILGVMQLLAFLPCVLLGPFAGALVDRISLKTVIVTSYALRGLLMLLLFLALAFTKNVCLVFALLALLSGCMAVSMLINTTLKQQVIPAEFRGRVFGTLDSLNSGLVPISLVLGGALIDLLGKNIALLFLGIFIVYAVLATAFVLDRPIRSFYLSGCPAAVPEDGVPSI